jgi:hypothetical protein
MTNEELEQKVREYIASGGEVLRIRYASEKEQAKARRREYHSDKAISGSESSQAAIARERKREGEMIFSRDERWKERANE